jgi:NAD(P)-dependent dehydrogenase (short-subunit alcohol dehydrogenase family)
MQARGNKDQRCVVSNATATGLAPMFDYARAPFPRESELSGIASAIKLRLPLGHARCGERAAGRLAGRKALITGGESEVARAAAVAFAGEGAEVAFNYLPTRHHDAEQVARLIREMGRKAVLLPGDLQDEESCRQLVAGAARELGGLDILVCNATRQQALADIEQMSTEQFDAAFKSNIHAMFWLTKAALPHMGPGSSIINTSAPTGGGAAEVLLDYSATKGAIMVFTKSVARQLASRGIRVNAVAPEPLWTPTSDDPPAAGHPGGGTGESAARCGRQAELASTYVLLASTESNYATGQLFGAVGGRPRQPAGT